VRSDVRDALFSVPDRRQTFEGLRLLDKPYYNGQRIEVGHVLQGVGNLTRNDLQERVELSSEVRRRSILEL